MGMEAGTGTMQRHHWTVVALALLTLAFPLPASGSEATPEEMKARFLVQLLKYVSWPDMEESGDAYVIGIERDAAMSEALSALVAGRRVNDRAIQVRLLPELDDVAGLHVLLLADGGRASLRRIAREHHGSAMLTVAERFDFPELGGDIGIELVRGRVSFSINRRKSVRGPLKISAKLLRVASEVR